MTPEKKSQAIYWAVTAPVLALITMSGVAMLMGGQENAEGLAHLGYPVYFGKILGPAKLLGVTAIIVGQFVASWRTLKEWAYAGISFNILAAAASHAFSGDETFKILVPLLILGVHLTGYRLWKKTPSVATSAAYRRAA